jgi:hypothetical protein
MTQVDDNRPHVVIAKDSPGRWHAGWRDAVFDDPLELPITVLLNIYRSQQGDWWGRRTGKGYAGILSITPVTDDTIKAKGPLASFDLLHIALDRVFIMDSANRNIVLGPLNNRSLNPARRSRLAAHKGDESHATQEDKDTVEGHRVIP